MMNASLSADQDALIAHAIERVLDEERAAQAQVAQCETQMRDLLEQARQRRREIIDHARQRIVRLHARVTQALELEDTRMREHHQLLDGESALHPQDSRRLNAALAVLSRRLTSPDE